MDLVVGDVFLLRRTRITSGPPRCPFAPQRTAGYAALLQALPGQAVPTAASDAVLTPFVADDLDELFSDFVLDEL